MPSGAETKSDAAQAARRLEPERAAVEDRDRERAGEPRRVIGQQPVERDEEEPDDEKVARDAPRHLNPDRGRQRLGQDAHGQQRPLAAPLPPGSEAREAEVDQHEADVHEGEDADHLRPDPGRVTEEREEAHVEGDGHDDPDRAH
jgi:hypothetical protein